MLRVFWHKLLEGNTRMKTDHAFTLIELLIVVAIISILAAIFVPNFLEAQIRSKMAVTQDDLHSLATALEAYWIEQRAYPPNLVKMVLVEPPAPGKPGDPGIFWAARIEAADGKWLCETSQSAILRMGKIPQPAAVRARPELESPQLYIPRPSECPLFYNGAALYHLTTPVPYIGSFPRDLFYPWGAGGHWYRPPAVFSAPDPTALPSWDLDSQRPYAYYNLTEMARDGVALPMFGRTVTYVVLSPGPRLQAMFTDPARPPTPYDPTNGTVSDGDVILAGSE